MNTFILVLNWVNKIILEGTKSINLLFIKSYFSEKLMCMILNYESKQPLNHEFVMKWKLLGKLYGISG